MQLPPARCALDATTGDELWQFDPFANGGPATPLASGGVNRGVAYWSDGQPNGERRILCGSASGHLYSVDSAIGKLDPVFGEGGVKDLRGDLELDLSKLPYGPTSAPATPCTYAVDGQQFVAIAAGGAGKLGTKAGDAIVCFALSP